MDQTKRKTIKVNVEVNTSDLIDSAVEALKARGLKEFNKGVIVDKAISKLGKKLIDEVIEEFTPIDYKFDLAMKDDQMKAQIMKLLNGKSPKKSTSNLQNASK